MFQQNLSCWYCRTVRLHYFEQGVPNQLVNYIAALLMLQNIDLQIVPHLLFIYITVYSFLKIWFRHHNFEMQNIIMHKHLMHCFLSAGGFICCLDYPSFALLFASGFALWDCTKWAYIATISTAIAFVAHNTTSCMFSWWLKIHIKSWLSLKIFVSSLKS